MLYAIRLGGQDERYVGWPAAKGWAHPDTACRGPGGALKFSTQADAAGWVAAHFPADAPLYVVRLTTDLQWDGPADPPAPGVGTNGRVLGGPSCP